MAKESLQRRKKIYEGPWFENDVSPLVTVQITLPEDAVHPRQTSLLYALSPDHPHYHVPLSSTLHNKDRHHSLSTVATHLDCIYLFHQFGVSASVNLQHHVSTASSLVESYPGRSYL